MDFLKVEGDSLFTPVVHYQSGIRAAVFIGAVHIGSPSYFERIQTILDHYENLKYSILFENCTTSPFSSTEMQEAWESFKKARDDLRSRFLNHYRLVEQVDALPTHSHWILADMSSEELIARAERINDVDFTWERAREFQKELSLPTITHVRKYRRNMLVDLLAQAQERRETSKDNPSASIELMVNQRESILLQTIKSEIQDRSIAIIYGSAHLPPINHLFNSLGFRITGMEWLEAMNLPAPSEN